MTARNLDQYGDGLFDILWKGALQPIIDDFNNSDDEKQESKISNISSESPTSTSKHCNPTRSRPTTEVSLPSQYSPFQPMKKKKKMSNVIQSDSDSDGDMPSTKITDDKLGTTLLDSDSDIEFVDEQRRPLRSPQCNQLQPEAIDLDDSVLDETVTESNYSPQYKLSNKAPDFKLPPLPLAPIRRSGLRSRNTNNAPVPQVLFTQKHPEKLKEFSIARSRTKLKPCSDNTSDIFSSDDEDEDFITPFLRTKARSKAANKFKVISDSDDSDSEKAPTAALGNKRTIKDVPISLEEELIGETHMSLSDDEDYQQDANGDLIEREAQCAVIDSDEWDSDGDLEKSFINDQTLCSQQLSQDTMHGLYLNSLVDRDGRGGMW